MKGEQRFLGIDWGANDNWKSCVLHDNGEELSLAPDAPANRDAVDFGLYQRTAVDCPFGTTRVFQGVLTGAPVERAFPTAACDRASEVAIRERIGAFHIVRLWNDLAPGGPPLFNSTGHIQSTVRLSIVPDFLNWFVAERFAGQAIDNGSVELVEARLGHPPVVEAHPRAFLYSCIELLHELPLEWAQVLPQARDYKTPTGRGAMLHLLGENIGWMGDQVRDLGPVLDHPQTILASDHDFDAFLAALTAWAHGVGVALWAHNAAGLADETVAIEGHLLILDTAP
ncbi:MAG: hypothetical protein F9K44_07445 [Hyphomicrobiaceae bacterium]|nr:MAG: hypothetical protein F9K44_07445 [Hyphomicrobiaceae bacterium]